LTSGPSESVFPRPGFNAFGFRCEFLNYGDGPMLNISTEATFRYKGIIHSPDQPSSGRESDAVEGSEVSHIEIPRIEGKGKFEFFIINYSDPGHFIDIELPTKVRLETKDSPDEIEAPVRTVNNGVAR
jgi:hypothetical protein